MADEGVKTLHVFSRIETGQNAIIKRIKLSRRRDITLVSSGDEFLHLLEGEKLLKTVRLPAHLLCAEFCCCDDQKLILALTKDGKVWTVPVPAKKSKKSKSNEAPTDGGQGSKSSDQDIFSGLLTGSGGAVSSNSKADSLTPSDIKSLKDMGSESLVIFEPNAESVVYIGGNIITSGRSEGGVTVSFYIRTGSKSGKLIYPALPTFRTTIPVPNQPSSIFYEPRSEDATYTGHSKTNLLCICPAEGSSSSSGPHLKGELFGQLFGRDTLLLCSPVLLVGCGNGRIYFIPLNVPRAETTVMRDTGGGKEEGVTFSPKLLYDLEQDLFAIHLVTHSSPSERRNSATEINRNAPDERTSGRKETTTANSNAVLFVGSRGRLVLAEENCSEKAVEFGVNFSVYNVPAPVLCSCVSSKGDVLVHSTGQEVFVTKLCPELSTASTSCVSQSLPAGLTPKLIMISNVCAIFSGIKPQRHRSDAGVDEGDQILALTFKGRLLDFSLLSSDNAESSEFQSSPLLTLTPDMAARKVKDALINIEEVSKQLSKVHLIIEAEDQILKEVNIAINIICDSMTSSAGFAQTELQPEARKTQMPITCTFSLVVKSSDGLQSSVMLQCSVTNQSKRSLSGHWQLLLQLRGYKQWFSSEENHYITVNHSVSLGLFNPGSSRELSIPLDGEFDVMFSVNVEAFLLCDLRSLLARAPGDMFKNAESLPNVSNVIVPVTRKAFDALHFLRSQSVPTGSSRVMTPGSLHELADTMKILNSVPQGVNVQSQDKPGQRSTAGNPSSLHQLQSASLRLSQDCLIHVKALVKDMFCESLTAKQISELMADAAPLLFLLADSGLTPQQVSENCSLVTMETINGELITLHLRSLGETPACATASESLVTTGGVELSIRAASVQLLSSVHEAVLRRLEPVISRNGNRKSTPLHHIQKALAKLENLQKVSASLSNTLSSRQQKSQMTPHAEEEVESCLVLDVWQLYQQLRQVQLILP